MAAILTTVAASASAQAPAPQPPAPSTWSVSPALMVYAIPDEGSFVQPSVSVDHGRLHLEGRYNYEDRETGSAWIGINTSGGDAVWWEFTPMIGVVLGQTSGVAPGYRGAIGWKRLEVASEGEYVFDSQDSSASFLYNWSEATVSLFAGLRVGVAAQRTRLYGSATRDIQRGIIVGTSLGPLDATVYVFNPDDSRPIVIASLAVTF